MSQPETTRWWAAAGVCLMLAPILVMSVCEIVLQRHMPSRLLFVVMIGVLVGICVVFCGIRNAARGRR
jgi:hypothetical protein